MPTIIAIITVFPVIVALLLRGRHFKRVLILAPLNLAINVIAFEATKPSANSCNSYAHTDCNLADRIFWLYVIITILNIVFSVFIWYLAFARKAVTASADAIAEDQFARQKPDDKEILRKVLKVSGAVIVLGIISVVVFFVVLLFYALSQI